MASITRDSNGNKRIQFVAENGARKAIRLGKVTLRDAEVFKRRIEDVLAGRRLGRLDPGTAEWVAGLPGDLHGKLAAVGLVEERVNATLGAFLDDYLESRTDLKPNSHLVYGHTRRVLVEFFGRDKSIREITEQDAKSTVIHRLCR